MDYMKNPSSTFYEYVQTLEAEGKPFTSTEWYLAGEMAFALEMITLIKDLESMPVVTERSRQETISTLVTLLRETGLWDTANDTYRTLCRWRRPKFESVNGDGA